MTKKENTAEVLRITVRELKLPVTFTSILEELEKHPYPQTLLAISEILKSWGLSSASYEVEAEELLNEDIPYPLIINTHDGFVIVHEINELQATISNDLFLKKIIPFQKFKDLFLKHVLVLAHSKVSVGEVNYRQKRQREILNMARTPFLLGCCTAFLAIGIAVNVTRLGSQYGTAYWLIILEKILGSIISILLLIQSVDSNNTFINRICKNGKKTDCNAILSSDAAKIFGLISWSEIGFFYFTGSLLALMATPTSGAIAIFCILNLTTLPYTLFSIFYQWRIAKQWCKFCCAVQALFWAEFFSFLPFLKTGLQRPFNSDIVKTFLWMTIPFIVWTFIKPLFQKAKEAETIKKQLRAFRSDISLFNGLLQQQTKLIVPNDEDTLIVGNRSANKVITMISDPYCKPCARAHASIEQILSGRDDIKLQILFKTQNDLNDPKTKVALHILSLASSDEVLMKQALHDWFARNRKDFHKWTKKHPVMINPEKTNLLAKQIEWCRLADINETPTLFYNGRRIPFHYRPEDIKYLI